LVFKTRYALSCQNIVHYDRNRLIKSDPADSGPAEKIPDDVVGPESGEGAGFKVQQRSHNLEPVNGNGSQGLDNKFEQKFDNEFKQKLDNKFEQKFDNEFKQKLDNKFE
jgi:hypothetical protein